MAVALSPSDKKWRAQDDARTLATAEEIKMDSARLNLAQSAAKTMAEEEAKRAQAMRKIAGQKKGSTSSKKPAKKKSKGSGSTANKHNTFKRI